ncbi:MAG TPA: DUF1016 N-terminal domain-containing protein [Polyangiaceae bacterium]|nr:DUF1016 N-terminal domain-containing protein [Polyangiaceae bacterium]
MIKQLRKKPSKTSPKKVTPTPKEIVSAVPRQLNDLDTDDAKFAEVLALVETARNRAYQAINSELVTLYWQLGEHISQKIQNAEWGDGVVVELAAALARRYSGLRGFTRPNLFRMRQFYEAYRGNKKVSALLRQLPWTHHMLILGQAKRPETREFYILAAIRERWTSRELERQIQSGAILRSVKARTMTDQRRECYRSRPHVARMLPDLAPKQGSGWNEVGSLK